MNLRSPWAAAGFCLGTAIVCYCGVRTELTQARLSRATQAVAHLAIDRAAEQVCGTDAAGGC